MGIPLYFKHIVTEHPEIINKTDGKMKINNIFFDLNCAIHPCCAGKTDTKEMLSSILEKIKECIKITNVTDLVYIAIDGPAPRTKMEQQRQRRLKSSNENKIWDTNQITPGTNFMRRLNIFLKKEIKKLNIKVVLSDSNKPGEGEHKIMDYLDKHINKDDINCVYGLDADLIMLSMIRNNNIYLLREKTEYNIEGVNEPYVYLNINLLKRYLIDDIKILDIYEISDENILNDYLFMCFLIGNDFITNTPCINIRYDGLKYLKNIYTNLQKDKFGMFFLTEKSGINFDNFSLFINEISKRERNIITTILKKRKYQEERNSHRYKEYLMKITDINDISNFNYSDFVTNDKDMFDRFVNYSPLCFRNAENDIFQSDIYNLKYYLHGLYNTTNYDPSFKMILKNDIFNVCEEYLKSIIWTYKYYFHKCPSWRWYYKYDFAPLMVDFNDYLQQRKEITFQQDKPYSPEEQLKIVLPKLEKNYMYPSDTPIYSLFKNYYWECHAILPH